MEHPDITAAMATGYPRGHDDRESDLICSYCGEPILWDAEYYTFPYINIVICEDCMDGARRYNEMDE